MEIQIDGLNVHYIENNVGSKTNIILLHGWGVDSSTLECLTLNLSKKFNVFAIDMPGFGKSDKPDKTFCVEDYSKIILQFITRKELENVVLIGHSFGGRVIIKLVGKLGYKPQKIILIDSAGIRPKRTCKYYIKLFTYKCIKNVAKVIFSKEKYEKLILKYREKTGSQDYNNADEVMKEVFKNVVNEDLTKYLKYIDVPTLLIWGEKDIDTPLQDGKLMEKLIPNAGLVVLKGAGHYSYLENLNEFLIIQDKFLEGCE